MKLAQNAKLTNWAAAILMLSFTTAHAKSDRSFYELSLNPTPISVSQDRGGNIAMYIVKAEGYRADQSMVSFKGQCDSACTLLLGLTPAQICIQPGASFRFHAPIAQSAAARKSATRIMMEKYPDWVKDWLKAQGGLKPQLMTMSYHYASKHVQSCDASVY